MMTKAPCFPSPLWRWPCPVRPADMPRFRCRPEGRGHFPQGGTPEDTYGDLYRAVELARVFPDSKTFADMVPLDGPAAVMAAYKAENPQGKEALSAFVAKHFLKIGDRISTS
jgi:hypothetical protein